MRVVILLFILALATATSLAAPWVTAGATVLSASTITGSTTATVTGTLVYGGLGTTPDATWSGKVVLLDRGTIGFLAKVQAVQNAGGVACVIANNVTGTLTDATLGAGNTALIPAVTISLVDGTTLKAKVGTSVTVGAAVPSVITADPLPSQAGHAGKVLVTDGTKASWASLVLVGPASASTVAAGRSLVFLVWADGTPPLTYQWSKNGTPIVGATSATLTISNVSASDAGSYTCTAANSAGSKTSGPYVLTVTP